MTFFGLRQGQWPILKMIQVFNQKLFHGPDHTFNWVGVQGRGGGLFLENDQTLTKCSVLKI